jgi:1,4-dihydroxy-2-naphthoate octaprenyltransferase
MARPLLLLVVVPIYIIGCLIARVFAYELTTSAFLWGLAALIPVVIAAHYANEYADVETDALTERTPFSGGSGALPAGEAPRSLALVAAWVFLGLGAAVALAGLVTGHLNLAALSMWAIGTLVGLAYSLPPFKLAWRGWSEAINTGLIALILPLYGFAVHTQTLDWRVFVGCLPFALLIFVLILSTNWADRDADAQVGKKTLATRLAPRTLRWLYLAAVLLGIGLQLLLIGAILPPIVVLSSLLALPVLLWAASRFTRIHSPLPTVLAMLVLMPLQLGAWVVAGS